MKAVPWADDSFTLLRWPLDSRALEIAPYNSTFKLASSSSLQCVPSWTKLTSILLKSYKAIEYHETPTIFFINEYTVHNRLCRWQMFCRWLLWGRAGGERSATARAAPPQRGSLRLTRTPSPILIKLQPVKTPVNETHSRKTARNV